MSCPLLFRLVWLFKLILILMTGVGKRRTEILDFNNVEGLWLKWLQERLLLIPKIFFFHVL